MKIFTIVSMSLALMAAGARAASVYWSFTTAGGGSYAGPTNASLSFGSPTLNNGFQETPVLTGIRGSGPANISGFDANTPPGFLHPETGTTYNPSYGMNWGSGANSETFPNLNGAGFAVTLNTTGLTDLEIWFDVRSAFATNSDGLPATVGSVRYSLNGTDWDTLAVTSLPSWGFGSWETGKIIDLSLFDELADREELHLEIIFDGGPKTNNAAIHNMRITNLYVSAAPIPEPSGAVGAAAGACLLAFRRRK